MALRIGELLIEKGLLTEEQLNQALQAQQGTGQKVGEVLVRLGFVDEVMLIKVLARQLRLFPVELDVMPPPEPEVLELVPEEAVRRLKAIPLRLKGKGVLAVAMTDPSNQEQVDELAHISGLTIDAMISPPTQIARLIERSYQVPPALASPPTRSAAPKLAAPAEVPPERVKPKPPEAPPSPAELELLRKFRGLGKEYQRRLAQTLDEFIILDGHGKR